MSAAAPYTIPCPPADWATQRATDVAAILRPGISRTDAVAILAAHFRAVEATGAKRGTEQLAKALGVPFQQSEGAA